MEFVQHNILWITAAIVSGIMLVLSLFQLRRGDGVTPDGAVQLINRENAIVVDVRDYKEWSAAHLPNARHLALDVLEKNISELEKFKTRPIVFYCGSGVRSDKASATARRLGFENVFSLEGGIAAWREAGMPVEK